MGVNMEKKSNTVDRTVISVSLTKNDKEKIKEFAARNEITASALLCRYIREEYKKIERID